MSNGVFPKVTAKAAAEVCQHFELGDAARGLLRDGLAPKMFLDSLVEKKQFPDAVRFLAHALPKREAVWWACVCARAAVANPPAKAAAALQAAEKWVADPKEEHRRAAGAAAQAAGIGSAAGLAAMAAFWSGGSLGPPDLPPIPPGEFLTARGVSGAVLIAATLEPAKAVERHKLFLAKGVEVANGTNKWKQ